MEQGWSKEIIEIVSFKKDTETDYYRYDLGE